MECLPVQIAFMKVLLEKDGLQTLLRQRVPYEGIEVMLERIWHSRTADVDESSDKGDEVIEA